MACQQAPADRTSSEGPCACRATHQDRVDMLKLLAANKPEPGVMYPVEVITEKLYDRAFGWVVTCWLPETAKVSKPTDVQDHLKLVPEKESVFLFNEAERFAPRGCSSKFILQRSQHVRFCLKDRYQVKFLDEMPDDVGPDRVVLQTSTQVYEVQHFRNESRDMPVFTFASWCSQCNRAGLR